MALPEIIAPRGQPVIAVGVDPTTGKYYPLPVDPTAGQVITGRPTSGSAASLSNLLQQQDYISYLAAQGKVWSAAPGAGLNTTVTGQTSFASTTPTFLLDVPSGICVIPLYMSLCQTGTVAGGDIGVLMGKDKIKRYSSGGTEASYFRDRSDIAGSPSSHLYTSPTATSGVATRMMGLTIAADVSPAEGVINEIVWTPAGALEFLVGPATWLVSTYAGTTGPTWFWSFKWAEILATGLP